MTPLRSTQEPTEPGRFALRLFVFAMVAFAPAALLAEEEAEEAVEEVAPDLASFEEEAAEEELAVTEGEALGEGLPGEAEEEALAEGEALAEDAEAEVVETEVAMDQGAPEAEVVESAPEELQPEVEAEVVVDQGAPEAEMGDDAVVVEPSIASSKEAKAWTGSVNAATSSSMAMFHPTEYVRSYGRSLSLSLGGRASYRLSEKVSASAGVGAAVHALNPKDASGRRFWLSDPSLGISHSSLFKDEAFTGINISGSLGATIGLSPSSIYWNRYGSLSSGLTAGRGFLDGRLNVGWSLSVGASLSRYTSPVVDKLSDDGLDMALARADGGEFLAGRFNLVSGNAQLGSLGNTLSLSFRAMEGLNASLSFGVSHGYRYCPTIDHLSSEAVDVDGERIVRQGDVCRGDNMIGSFGASYDLGGGYNLSASFSSAQPVFAYRGTSLTEENRVLRFPWWDPDLHMTSFSLRAARSF